MKIIDMSGQVFGSMTVLDFSHTAGSRAWWLCKCVCGVEKAVRGKHLRAGRIVSCGCQRGPKVQFPDKSARRKEVPSGQPERKKAYHQRYYKNNREAVNAINRTQSAKYRAKRRKLSSVPKWADKEMIELVYKKADQLGMEVDHIVPLVSPYVCGLHTWENLQLLDMPLNRSKGNKYWPDMPELPNKRLPDNTIKALTL